jgi:hypothetical protein
MPAGKSNQHEQVRIGDSDQLESQPLTWDGEPLYSPDTIREALFDGKPFEQIRGQLSIDAATECDGRCGYLFPHKRGDCGGAS